MFPKRTVLLLPNYNRTMKRVIRATAVFVLCVASNGFAIAQNKSASVSVGDACSVAQPITLQNVTGLNFGGIQTGSIAGNVAISANNLVTPTSSATGPAAYTGSNNHIIATAATFFVTGEPGLTYTISTPATTVVSSGANTMTVTFGVPVAQTVSGHAPSGSLNANGTTSAIAASGYDAWAIGGTLAVKASQPSGAYSGTFSEKVQYQ